MLYKQQPLIRGRGVSYCKNLLSPRFEHSEGLLFLQLPPFLPSVGRQFAHKFMILKLLFSYFSFCLVGHDGESEEALDKTYYVFLPAELCFVHPLPGSLVRGAQRLPSIMRRVESMLLAVQLKNIINYPIPASKVSQKIF